MRDFGVLISLPTESVAVRATVGSLVGLLLVSLVLRSGLRVPRVRSLAVLVPMVAVVCAVGLSWRELLLPVLMTSTTAEDALRVLVRRRVVGFAPVGWPLLMGWLLVGSVRVARRLAVMRRVRLAAAIGSTPDARLRRITSTMSRQLRAPLPHLAVIERCPGGAIVVGIRRPRLVVDAELLGSLDDEELEGLLAHELAHIRRRDNLLALVVGLITDLVFFVPGGRWVARRLCSERELAADQIAVAATGRPGALASGLLKVLDTRRPAAACAAFAAPVPVVARVERLLADTVRGSAVRTACESALVAAVLTAAVGAALLLPAAITRAGQHDALALLWAWRAEEHAPPAAGAAAEATAFDVFRRRDAAEPVTPAITTLAVTGGQEFDPGYVRGLRDPATTALRAVADDRVWLRPGHELLRRWRATPVVTTDPGVGVYWLYRLEVG